MDNNTENRLRAIELARDLGNVTEACRRTGVDRTSFYKWRNRFEKLGVDGLVDRRSGSPRKHPLQTSVSAINFLYKLSLAHPSHGCRRLKADLHLRGHDISSVTVQKLLKRGNLGTKLDRLRTLEQKYCEDALELSAEQIDFLEQHNPCFKERTKCTAAPGEFVVATLLPLGRISDVGRVYVHALIDAYSGFVFGETSKDILFHINNSAPEIAARNTLVNFGLTLGRIMDDISFSSKKSRRSGPIAKPNRKSRDEFAMNGFSKRFNDALERSFFSNVTTRKVYREFDDLQCEFRRWLHRYNFQTIHHGYPNYGQTPSERLFSYNNVLSDSSPEQCQLQR